MIDLQALIDKGIVTVVGDKMYATCQGCGKLIQINKPLLGSLHLCL